MKLTIGIVTIDLTENDKNILNQAFITEFLNRFGTLATTQSPTTATAPIKKPTTRKRKVSAKKETVKKPKESDIPDHILGGFSDVSDIMENAESNIGADMPDHDTSVQPVRKDTTITAPTFTTQRQSQVFEKQSKYITK